MNDGYKLETVKVANIPEYATELGGRCLLLESLGINPYSECQEKVRKVLIETAKDPKNLEICKKSSRCGVFSKFFERGETPFLDKDPIRIIKERNGQYTVAEGKHRVCMAKRGGFSVLQAYIWDAYPIKTAALPEIGRRDEYKFLFTFTKFGGAIGDCAVLWLKARPHEYHRFLLPEVLDEKFDTKGEFCEPKSGLRYKVSVKRGFLGVKTTIEARVIISQDHDAYGIWLLRVPVKNLRRLTRLRDLDERTLYRYGCWKEAHAFGAVDPPNVGKK